MRTEMEKRISKYLRWNSKPNIFALINDIWRVCRFQVELKANNVEKKFIEAQGMAIILIQSIGTGVKSNHPLKALNSGVNEFR